MSSRGWRTARRLALAVALGASTIWVLLDHWVATPTGLTRTLYPEPGFGGDASRVDVVPGPDLDFTTQPHGPRRFFSARWSGVWYVDRAGTYDLSLGADDAAVLSLHDSPVLERNSSVGYSTTTVTRELTAGAHRIEVEYEQGAGRWFLSVGCAPHGEEPRPLPAASLFPTAPTPRQVAINKAIETVWWLAMAIWVVVLALFAWAGVDRVRQAVRQDARGWRGVGARAVDVLREPARVRWLATAALLLVVVAAAALRFETICVMYGPFERPGWLFELEAHTRERIHLLRPVEFFLGPVADPYAGGDPINYLRIARGMTSFYAAHVREPVFPFATKIWLALTDDQDVAVSLASACFSTLTVIVTYLLGSYAFSRWVGLGAALAFAIERDAIAWAAEGWRDDAMAFVFVTSCYALLRCAWQPSIVNAIAAGVIGGIACLTRITTLSFLLPGIALVAWAGIGGSVRADGGGRARGGSRALRVWREPHGRAALIALVVMATVVAPYVINCAIVFGDPLYAINSHTRFYRARGGLPFEQPMSVATYLGVRLGQDPFGTIATFVKGVTTFPFTSKWIGFAYWSHWLKVVLEASSVVGLILFVGSRTGRFLLVLLVTSLVPYAFTWQIPGGGEWRFTMHAYPIYLIASALALERLGRLALALDRARRARLQLSLTTLSRWRR